MLSSINRESNPNLFNRLVQNAQQKDGAGNKIYKSSNDVLSQMVTDGNKDNIEKFKKASLEAYKLLMLGRSFQDVLPILKRVLPDTSTIKESSLGICIMAEGWSKPIVFPNKDKFIGWIDNPQEITTEQLWQKAYGKQPAIVFGAVGYSNFTKYIAENASISKEELTKDSGIYLKRLLAHLLQIKHAEINNLKV